MSPKRDLRRIPYPFDEMPLLSYEESIGKFVASSADVVVFDDFDWPAVGFIYDFKDLTL